MIWPTILIAMIVFALALTGMAIGVLVSNRRLRGSCGGLANMRNSEGSPLCEACSNPSPDCLGNPPAETTDEQIKEKQRGG